MMPVDDRIVVLIDMDCFYVQVEQRREPSVRGKPCAVVQYNKWKGGGIIAVSYEARAKGVTRQMRGDDAKEKCPEITLLMVPTAHGKADLTRYRDAGAEVIDVLLQFGGTVERASIDEAYIDLTNVVNERVAGSQKCLPDYDELENTHVIGYPQKNDVADQDKRLSGLKEYYSNEEHDSNVSRLSYAASVVEEMRAAIYQQTSFRCSAGISHNKMLAKLACGINKPNKQTILPMEGVPELFAKTRIGKIRNLGGKLGMSLSMSFKIDFIGEVTEIPSQQLNDKFGIKTGLWLSEVCRGIDHEPVKERHVAQSVGCSKNFNGADALNTRSKVKHWVGCLVTELVERLNKDKLKNNRVAFGLTLHVGHSRLRAISRSCHIDKYEVEHVIASCMATLETLNEAGRKEDSWSPAITMLGIASKNFKDASVAEGNRNVASMLATQMAKSPQKVPASPVKANRPTSKPKKRGSIDFFTRQIPKFSEGEKAGSTSSVKPSESEAPVSDQESKLRTRTPSPGKSAISRPKPSPAPRSSFFSQLKKSKSENTKTTEVAKDVAQPSYDAEYILIRSVTQTEKVETAVSDDDVCITSVRGPSTTAVPEETKPGSNNRAETQNFSYKMADIDKEVFLSLPLFLQKEIESTAQHSPKTASKKRTSSNSDSQNSISKFLRPTSVNFAQGDDNKQKRPSSGDEKAKKSRSKAKKNAHTVYDVTSVPLGFFRARSQASAAIHNALRAAGNESSDRTENVANTANPTSRSVGGKSLWSSLSEAGPRYKCDECGCMVAICDVSSHSEFHEARNREKAHPEAAQSS